MGLFGGDSKSSTSNYVDSRTNNANQEGALAATTGDNNFTNLTINQTDLGAVNSAFDFATEGQARAFEFGNNSVDEAFNLSRQVTGSILDQQQSTLNKAIQAASDNSNRAYQFAAAVASPDKAANDITKYFVIGAVVIAVAAAFRN